MARLGRWYAVILFLVCPVLLAVGSIGLLGRLLPHRTAGSGARPPA